MSKPVTKTVQPRLSSMAQKRLNEQLAKVIESAEIPLPAEALDLPSLDRTELATTWDPTDASLDEIFKLALTGLPDTTIAVIGCNVPYEIFQLLLEEHSVLKQTIMKGRLMGEVVAARVVMNEMLDCNSKSRVSTAQFYLKTRADWSHKMRIEMPAAPEPKLIPKLSDGELLRQLSRSTLRSDYAPVTYDQEPEVEHNPAGDA